MINILTIVYLTVFRCETTIITETIARVDLSSRPFRLWTEAMVSAEESGEKVQPIMTKSLIVATGATAKRLYLPGEETSVTLYVLDGYFNAFC